jgi:ketosteroid isomerase-like protein
MTRFMSIIILLALTACGQQPDKPKVNFEQEEQSIHAISMKWIELKNAQDLAGEALLFTDDGIVVWENKEPAVGHSAIHNLYALENEQNPNKVSGWTSDKIEIAASGDIAVEYGSWKSTGGGMNGTEDDYGKYVTFYRKVNDTWKVAIDISNSTRPKEASE